MKNTLFIFSVLISYTQISFSQNEGVNWYFGINAGLSFSSGSPTPLTGCIMNSHEASAVQSDPLTGKLLFYSDAQTIRDSTHAVMLNGSAILGDYSSCMGALIVPKPQNPNLFYLFTAGAHESLGNNGFRYTVVDMSQNGGLGAVDTTQKNVILHSPASEYCAAYKHNNCNDWWVVGYGFTTNCYRAYLLTSSGITDTVVSCTGTTGSTTSIGQGKFSPDGTKFALADLNGYSVQISDFDAGTGVFSNTWTLATNSSFSGSNRYIGLSFSPDNSKLYVMHGNNGDDLYQYNMLAGSPASIISSAILIGTTASVHPRLQIGPDQRIYISNFLGTSLHAINNPNNSGVSCGLVNSSIPISGQSNIGLPNFPDNYFNLSDPCNPTTSLSETQREKDPSVIIYPNPTESMLNIKLSVISSGEIELYTLFGEKVLEVPFSDSHLKIDLKHLKASSYFYIVFDKENSPISQGRIIVK